MARNKLEIVVTVLDQAGKPLQKISAELGQVERAAKKAGKRTRGFGTALGGLGKLLGPLAAGLGVAGLTRAAYNWASGASKAEIATRLFRKQLERMGQDADAGTAKLEAVAQRLGVLPQDLAEYSTQLLRQGLTMDEIATLARGAAASALAAGKSTKEGIDAVTNAVVTQQSIYLNYAGIAENLNQAYKDMAKTLGKSIDALTKEEKARAAVNLVMQATKEEVGDLDQLLGGLPGKQNALNKEWAEFRQELGERLIPAISELVELATAGLRALNDLFNWLDHVFGDKVKLAFRDAKEQAREFRRELAKSKSYDDFIGRLDQISEGLTGKYKEAWDAYIKKLKETKGAVKDLEKAEEEAAKKRLALQLAQAKAEAAQAQNSYKALLAGGLSAKAFARFPAEVRERLMAAQGRGPRELLETIVKLQDEYKKLNDGTYEHLERFHALAEQWAMADAKVKALKESINQLNGAIKSIPTNTGLAGSGDGGGSGGLAGDADKAAAAFDGLTQSIIEYIRWAREAQKQKPVFPASKSGGYGSGRTSWQPEPPLGRVAAAPEPGRGIAGGKPLPNPIPNLPGWNWDIAGREAAASFANGMADFLRDKAYHKLLEENEKWVAGFAAETEEGVNKAFLRSLVSSRSDVAIAAAARDVGRYLDQQIYEAMVRGSRDHGIEAAVRQQAADAKRWYESNLRLIYRDPRRPGSFGFNSKQAADYFKSHQQRDYKNALANGSMDHGIEANLKQQERAAEKAEEAFREAAAASEKMAANIRRALDDLDKMGDALSTGDVGEWFDGLSGMLDKIPVIGGLLSELTKIVGKFASWGQWFSRGAELRSLYAAQQQYAALDETSLVDKSAYAHIEKYQEKAFFGLFSVDRYRTEIDDFALGIAQTLEQGVQGGLSRGMLAFLEGKDDWKAQLHDGIKGAIERAVIDAVIQGAVFKGALGNLLTELTKALANGDRDRATELVQQIGAAMPQVENLIETTLTPLKDALGVFSGDDQASRTAVSNNAIHYELPQVSVMTSPTWSKKLERAADRIYDAAEMFSRAVEGFYANGIGTTGAVSWQLRNASAT